MGSSNLTLEAVDRDCELELIAETTISTTDGIKGLVDRLVSEGNTRFIFDFAEIQLVHSGLLGSLVSCYTRATRSDCRIFLTHVSPRGRDVFDQTKLSSIFPIFDSLEDAIASFGEGEAAV
jgi:anti-anti-sigma factor